VRIASIPGDRMRVVRPSIVPPRRQIAMRMEARILDGLYPPGARLPSVRALSERLGVHRNTTAAVYRELRERGLVTSQPGSGVFVAERLAESVPAHAPWSRGTNVDGSGGPDRRAGAGFERMSLAVALSQRRVLLLCDDAELGALLSAELEARFPGVHVRSEPPPPRPLPGLHFGWLPVRVELGDTGSDPPPARWRLPVGLSEHVLRRLQALSFPSILGVVSRSPALRRAVRHAVRATCGHEVGFVPADPRIGRQMRQAATRATLVVADLRTVPALRGIGIRALPLRLVPRRPGAELLGLFEGWTRGDGDEPR
jgi:hypothetical protein